LKVHVPELPVDFNVIIIVIFPRHNRKLILLRKTYVRTIITEQGNAPDLHSIFDGVLLTSFALI